MDSIKFIVLRLKLRIEESRKKKKLVFDTFEGEGGR